MGNKTGVLKVAAKRIGIPYETYIHNVALGLKYCFKCCDWLGVELFQKDASRGDGLKSKCQSCCSSDTRAISYYERNKMQVAGFDYCRHCNEWLPINQVRGGICKKHINEEERLRYKNDITHRMNRRQHSHSRKRGVAPIPAEGQQRLLETFNYKCAYCDNAATTWDHIIPISKAGETVPDNVVPACTTCNSSKKDKEVFQWLKDTGRFAKEEFYDRLLMGEILPA